MALVFEADRSGDGRRVDQQVGRVDVDRYRHRPDPADRLRGGDEGIRRQDHLMSRADPGRPQCELQRIGAVRDADAVVDPGGVRVGLLELGDRLTADERRGGEDLFEARRHLFGDLRMLGDQIDQRDSHRASCLSDSRTAFRPLMSCTSARGATDRAVS